jgi:glycerophosphoryl diester phosphodiesterase
LLAAFAGAAESPRTPTPLPRAHAHNDYEHKRPLFDAIDRGFCGVEADVWLVDGKLLVAHDRDKVIPERTLEALYLEPLRARVARNDGRVFPGGPTVTLLIDVKSEATNTYVALREVLRRHEEMLTRFHPDRTETNAITIVISGNRARDLMAAESLRLAAYDGRVADLDSDASPHFIPLISDNWTKLFRWKAGADEGPISADEKVKLMDLVTRAHGQGRRLRLWAAPDNPAMWQVLFDAGVDFINTDNLDGLEKFLLASKERQP